MRYTSILSFFLLIWVFCGTVPCNAQVSYDKIRIDYLDKKPNGRFASILDRAIYMAHWQYHSAFGNTRVEGYTDSPYRIDHINSLFIDEYQEDYDEETDEFVKYGHRVFKVRSFTNFSIEVVADDGFIDFTVRYNKITIESEDGKVSLYNSERISDDIIGGVFQHSRADKKYEIRIPHDTLHIKTISNGSGKLNAVGSVDISWIHQAAELEKERRDNGVTPEDEFGGAYVDKSTFETERGKYIISLYKSPKCTKEFDIVTIRKDSGPEFRVERVLRNECKFDVFEETITCQPIIISKPGGHYVHTIFDDVLWNALAGEIKNFEGFDNAYKAYRQEFKYTFDLDGNIVQK